MYYLKFRLKRIAKRVIQNPKMILNAFNLNKLKKEVLNLFNKQINFENLPQKKQIELLLQSIDQLKKITFIENKNFIFEFNNLSEFKNKYKNDVSAMHFANLFFSNGSDKSLSKLSFLYWDIIKQKKIENLLEFGLGSENLSIPGNIRFFGKPNGSVRAFGSFLNNSKIFGADIDKKILINEKNIQTFFCNQLDKNSLINLKNSVPKMDLIIDDGLSRIDSIMNTISIFINHLTDGGFMVVEHIEPVYENIIKLYMNYIVSDGSYRSQIIYGTGNSSNLIIQKLLR